MHTTRVRAVVTGAASGLGAAVAERLVASGARVALLDLPDSAGAKWAAELGDAAHWVPVDVTDADATAAAVTTARGWLGGINTLVSCAGISPPTPVLDRAHAARPLDRFRKVLDVNLVGLYDVLGHCAAAMADGEPDDDGERGVIVNIASIAAFDGQVGQSAYAASKGAVVALTLPLARELAPHGIRIVTVCPGIMRTPMLAGMSDAVRAGLNELPVFPKRLGEPAELAELVLSCLRIRYLNGTVLRLDGATRLPPS